MGLCLATELLNVLSNNLSMIIKKTEDSFRYFKSLSNFNSKKTHTHTHTHRSWDLPPSTVGNQRLRRMWFWALKTLWLVKWILSPVLFENQKDKWMWLFFNVFNAMEQVYSIQMAIQACKIHTENNITQIFWSGGIKEYSAMKNKMNIHLN